MQGYGTQWVGPETTPVPTCSDIGIGLPSTLHPGLSSVPSTEHCKLLQQTPKLWNARSSHVFAQVSQIINIVHVNRHSPFWHVCLLIDRVEGWKPCRNNLPPLQVDIPSCCSTTRKPGYESIRAASRYTSAVAGQVKHTDRNQIQNDNTWLNQE